MKADLIPYLAFALMTVGTILVVGTLPRDSSPPEPTLFPDDHRERVEQAIRNSLNRNRTDD